MAEDTITVSATAREEVAAHQADLILLIKGASFVRGSAALSKAREVQQLVAELQKLNLPADSFVVEDVRLEVSGGMALKSSAAQYQLRVRRVAVDDVVDVLGVISGAKNVVLNSLEWRYPDDDAMRNGWLAACLRRAMLKAQVCAETLGVRLIGVAALSETLSDEYQHQRFVMPQAAGKSRSSAALGFLSREEGDLPLGQRKQVEIRVEVSYRVSPLWDSRPQ
jgi:uncharacterized protein YggE